MCRTVTLSVWAEAKETKLRMVASRAVRKMSAFQRRGMATSSRCGDQRAGK